MLLKSAAPDALPMSAAAIDVNFERMPKLAVDELGMIAGEKVALLGAAFKPDVDDPRSSLALECAKHCKTAGAKEIVIHDPMFGSTSFDGIATRTGDLDLALRDADGIIVCASHSIYASPEIRDKLGSTSQRGIKVVDIDGTLGLTRGLRLEIRLGPSCPSLLGRRGNSRSL